MENQLSPNTYVFFQWGLIFFSSLTPILITLGDFGIASRYETIKIFVEITGICTAFLVAVLATGLKVFQFHENWLEFRETEQVLRSELHLFNAGLGGYRHASDKRALFVEHVERRIRKEVVSWESRAQPEEHHTDHDTGES